MPVAGGHTGENYDLIHFGLPVSIRLTMKCQPKCCSGLIWQFTTRLSIAATGKDGHATAAALEALERGDRTVGERGAQRLRWQAAG